MRSARVRPKSFDILVSVTGPGQIAFTRTPRRAASAAATRVNPSIPAFAAAYGAPHENADFADKLEMFKITPEPRAYIPGNTSRVSKNAPRKCTATTRSHSAGVISSMGFTGP